MEKTLPFPAATPKGPIYIYDAPMGSGKTTAMIDLMNRNKDRRFIFVTPYLLEVERIIKACPDMDFAQPEKTELPKFAYLQSLIKDYRNIATTHSLLSNSNAQMIRLIRERRYTLILDEVIEVVNSINLTKADKGLLVSERLIEIENDIIKWKQPEYKGRFDDIKYEATNKRLFYYRESMFWFLPIDIFTCFEEIFILTYLFEGSRLKHYLDIWMGRKYSYCFFADGELIIGKFDDIDFKRQTIRLLSVSDNARINEIGSEFTALSKTWFKRSTPYNRKILKNNVYCFFRNHTDSRSADRMWSVYKSYEDAIAGNGYRGCFAPCNERATNKYRERSVMAYVVNIYEHPVVKGWFQDYGQCLSDDSYALSFLLQWMYRSQIRDGKPVQLYLPSQRMRNILNTWLAA